MSQIVAVSKQGINVGTATDPNDFIFHSDYNTFKILTEGVTSVTVGSNSIGTVSVVHNLGVKEPFYAFGSIPGANVYQPLGNAYITNVSIGTDEIVTVNSYQIDAYNTTNTLFLTVFQNVIASATVSLKYYVFAKP